MKRNKIRETAYMIALCTVAMLCVYLLIGFTTAVINTQ